MIRPPSPFALITLAPLLTACSGLLAIIPASSPHGPDSHMVQETAARAVPASASAADTDLSLLTLHQFASGGLSVMSTVQ